jgi:DNA adenine methylase
MKTPIFLRWIGGKSKSINVLTKYVPSEYSRYWEPFLGGASMFFSIQPRTSILSDQNKHLIDCYKAVRDNPKALSEIIEIHRNNHSKDYYYLTRNEFNIGGSQIDQAARFLYLNRTCFNGIFRVNKKGEFNVPFGEKKNSNLPTEDTINYASGLLKTAILYAGSYDEVLFSKKVSPGDFVYLDPPYPPLNGTSNFTHYTKERFLISDQEKLFETAKLLNMKNCKVMISNADIPLIRKLYKDWNIYNLPVTRWVSANGRRYFVSELVIINFDVMEK